VRTLLLLLSLAPPAPPAAEQPTVMVVVGAPGTPDYEARFKRWADGWRQLSARAGARYQPVGGGPNDRQALQQALSAAAAGQSELWLVLIGHGTFDGRAAKLNLRGPDVSSDELAAWLKPIKRPLVVIDSTSASGPFLKALSGPDRVVITATRSGREVNTARLGGYLVEALGDPAADLDKDGETSLLEAFLVASKRVESAFSEAGLLATEHALLDDNGDGLGTAAALYDGLRPTRTKDAAGEPDGRRAHQLRLLRSAGEQAMPPQARRRRDQLELELFKLRDARARLGDDDYYRKAEPLMLELARLYRQSEAK
jgi:hypothetical protein